MSKRLILVSAICQFTFGLAYGGNFWNNLGLAGKDLNAVKIGADGKIYVGSGWSTREGIYLSSDNGASWQTVTNGIGAQTVWSLEIDNAGNIFAGTDNGIYKSTNKGVSWVNVKSTGGIVCLTKDASGNILAGTYGGSGVDYAGVFRSTDLGATWNRIFVNNSYAVTVAANGYILNSRKF